MREPKPPANEAQRLEALERYEVLDTCPEPAFDDIVALAAHVCGVPISLVSLVDEQRQWFKARVGLDAAQTPRAVSFCGHVVESGEPLEVCDARDDERFFDNPLVTGEPRVVFYSGSPLQTDAGLTLGTLCVIDHEPRQLSEAQRSMLAALARVVVAQLELRLETRRRTKLERELIEAARVAQAANRAKSAFLAHMSHELRTPLNSVIGFTQLLLKNRSGRLGERDMDHLGRIAKNGRHLLALINDVLDLSKVEAGEADLQLGEVDLGSMLASLVEALEASFQEQGNELCLSVPSKLAPIQADERKLRQIVTNLLANANKFTADGKLELHVATAPADSSRPIRIDVLDDGIGISAAKLALVFEPFRQADEGKGRVYEGTGLGLAISRRLASLQGFELGVESREGAGSMFFLKLEATAPRPVFRVPGTSPERA